MEGELVLYRVRLSRHESKDGQLNLVVCVENRTQSVLTVNRDDPVWDVEHHLTICDSDKAVCEKTYRTNRPETSWQNFTLEPGHGRCFEYPMGACDGDLIVRTLCFTLKEGVLYRMYVEGQDEGSAPFYLAPGNRLVLVDEPPH